MTTPTPEPLRFERVSIIKDDGVQLLSKDGTLMVIYGPSRERIAVSILNMHKAVEALKAAESVIDNAEEYIRLTVLPFDKKARRIYTEMTGQLLEAGRIARETLKSIEA